MKCGESDDRNDKYTSNYSAEKFYRLLIPKSNPLIIDVGAHIGESVQFFTSIFPEADIYSIEPDPDSYTKLERVVSDPSRALNIAIGSQTGKATFYQYDKSHLNSLYSINKNSIDSLGYATSSTGSQMEVSCLTLDDLFRELSLENRRIDLLKIDVQGAEVDILEGGKSFLKNVDNITLELNLFDFYNKKNSFLSVETLLPGFELYAITKISQNPMNFRTDWVEVFYRRDKKSEDPV